MSKFSLPLKKKIKKIQGLQATSELNNTNSKSLYNKMYYLEDEELMNTGNSQNLIAVLKNHLKVLESTLQNTREESFKAGFDEGKELVETKVKRQIEDISEEFGAMAKSLQYQYDKALEKMDKPLIKLAVKIAEKILGKELQHWNDYNDILLKQIKELLNEVVDQNKVTIYVNPTQIDWVQGVDLFNDMNYSSKSDISFAMNDGLKPGECFMETEDYIIEGVLSRQLDNIENEILDQDIKWKD